jgi:hypothetical protein
MTAARDRVDRIRAICLDLPGAVERPFGGHTSPAFRVRDKMFAVVSEDMTSMTLKAPPGVQGILVASDPERFFVPKYVGSKGWIGVRLEAGRGSGTSGARGDVLDWEEMAELIYESYCLMAPKRLLAQWEARQEK